MKRPTHCPEQRCSIHYPSPSNHVPTMSYLSNSCSNKNSNRYSSLLTQTHVPTAGNRAHIYYAITILRQPHRWRGAAVRLNIIYDMINDSTSQQSETESLDGSNDPQSLTMGSGPSKKSRYLQTPLPTQDASVHPKLNSSQQVIYTSLSAENTEKGQKTQ